MELLEKQNASDEDVVIHLNGSDVIVFYKKINMRMQWNILYKIMLKVKRTAVKRMITKSIWRNAIGFLTLDSKYKPTKTHINFLNHILMETPGLSGGGLIAKVWAFRKLEHAFGELLKGSKKWWSEQSIYMPLLIWSAIEEEVMGQRFVLKRGMIGLDYKERFFSIPNSGI